MPLRENRTLTTTQRTFFTRGGAIKRGQIDAQFSSDGFGAATTSLPTSTCCKKSLELVSVGWSMMSGPPFSTTTPPSMNTIWSATSRRSRFRGSRTPWSCFLGQGTHDVEHFTHQFGVKGEVGSSKSMNSSGFMARARAMATHSASPTRQLGEVMVRTMTNRRAEARPRPGTTAGFLGLVLHVDRGASITFSSAVVCGNR